MQRNRDAHTRSALGAVIAAGLALGLGGCIGGEDSGGNDLAGGGMSGTGITYGPVDAFGSIIVNGKRYDTDDAKIVLDELTNELERGMLVRVEWDSDGNDRKATLVEFDSQVIGPVDSFGPENETFFTVLGQRIHYTGRTRFKGCESALPSANDAVQVSGWSLDDGGFRASYVRCLEQDDGKYELEGRVQDHTPDESTFRLGKLKVDYSQADIDELPPVSQWDGFYVEVEGRFHEGKVFKASEVEGEDEDRLRGDDGDDLEFQGTISSLNPDGEADTFRINGVTVEVDARTEFDDALSDFSDLSAGLLVEVEGRYIGSGTNRRVLAEEIELGDGEVELGAAIEQIPDGGEVLFVGGIEVRVTERTVIEDEDQDSVIDFRELNEGDWLEIEGTRRDNDDTVYLEAIYIERENDEDGEFEYEGPLDDIDSGESFIKVINSRISYNSRTEFDETSPEKLRDGLDDNGPVLVEVEYYSLGDAYIAKEIELEDD